MPKSEYKSSIRSKKLIRNALIQLLTEKPLEKITVTDIVKRADINRGTFYAHYADINELLKSVGDEIISLLYEALSEVDYADLLQSPLPALFKISSFLEKDIEYFRLMFARVSAVPFIEKLQTAFIEFMENNTAIDSEIRESDEFKNRAYFFAGGVVNMYRAWFRGEIDGTLIDLAYSLNDIICSNFLLFKAQNIKQN